MALGSGCCCTKKTIAGLTHCVSGEGKDGNPPERSMRVKVAAMEALEHCLSCFEEKVEQKKEPEPSRPPERVTPPAPMPMPENTVRLTNYYDRIEAKSESVIIAEGRLVLLKAQQQAEVMDSPEMRKIMISADQNTDPQQPATTQRASTLPAPASPAPPQPQPPPPSAPPARRERGLFGVISRAWRSSDNQATPAAYQPTPPASKDAAPITRPLPLSK
jgi:hypothetical protein